MGRGLRRRQPAPGRAAPCAPRRPRRHAALPPHTQAYAYVAFWIATSAAVILWNKYILAYSGFPYPVTLTMWCAARRTHHRYAAILCPG